MAPHIVSWNDVKFSPVVSSSSTPSVVPIESLLSAPSAKSPIIPETSRARATPGAQPTSFFLGMGAGESETLDGSQQSDDSFLQHRKYFFKDGNVTFLVRRYLAHAPNVLTSPRSVAFYTVFTAISSLAIRCTSPLDLPSSAFVTTSLHRPSCR